MPQMSPILWLNMLFFFTMGLLLFAMLNYFISKPSLKGEAPLKMQLSQKNWKW
uniref:ATP synthase complex subunit 8 n=1 Tax=Engaeus lyelli TaxID=219696 RepID=W6MUX8_9EUCA|nr:ATP synthase F0 subunit 8 [Engaeus lyelli]CDL72544.1 ATP synthase F0 subunit 8 [Engaeus lyelli]